MITKIKARFSDGVLTPLDPVELKDGEVVTLHIENGSSRSATRHDEGDPRPEASVSPFVELLEEIRETATEVSWDDLPTDGAKNLRSYLYGRPKEDD